MKDNLEDLGRLLRIAHAEAAMNERCISTATLINAWEGSGNIAQAIAAAILTIGGKHAPIVLTTQMLRSGVCLHGAQLLMATGSRVPGWGNSFHRDGGDPIWVDSAALIAAMSPELAGRVNGITEMLHGHGIRVYPNAACWTACYAIMAGIRPELAPYLFVEMRLGAWYRIIDKRIKMNEK